MENFLNAVRQEVLWKRFVIENITESFWSLDSLKEQRSLTLSKVAMHVRLGDAVVYSGKCGTSP